MRPTVLVLVAYYVPAVKAGGPLRSIFNLAESLGDQINFRIVTSDRDKGDNSHYRGIQPDRWTKIGSAEVLYLSPENLRFATLYQLLASEKAEFLYLNSFFAWRFSIFPIWARAVGAKAQKQIILAPRGEFSPGALAIRPGRKRAYLQLAKRLPIYRHVLWHASSTAEELDIRTTFRSNVPVRVALDIANPTGASLRRSGEDLTKCPGNLRIAFLSRIVPKKNLLGAIRLLHGISGNIHFNIFGPPEDAAYWRQCQKEIDRLSGNIVVQFKSLIEHERVMQVLSEHHLFFFPTFGENYGHVICEALSSGCLALISDQTPWRGLERAGAGWDLPLDQPEPFRAALQACVAMNNDQFQEASASSRRFARDFAGGEHVFSANRALFEPATGNDSSME